MSAMNQPRSVPSRPAPAETGFVRLPQILSLIPISRSAWWAGIREGKLFPQGIKLGSNTTVWRAEDIRHLIERSR
jgi:predicted DNA-binding transcriptional regulator AlpA